MSEASTGVEYVCGPLFRSWCLEQALDLASCEVDCINREATTTRAASAT